jgi:hypothetical protein
LLLTFLSSTRASAAAGRKQATCDQSTNLRTQSATLEPAWLRPMVCASSAVHVPRGALYNFSSGPVLHLRPEAPRKSTICHTSPSQTPYTCSTAPQSALLHIMLMAPREGVLRTLPHRSQPVQRPCSSRNRKPIRPGAARWASWRGRWGQRSGAHLDCHRSR